MMKKKPPTRPATGPQCAGSKDEMQQWIQDLENIYQKAMEGKKLPVALKAKELLAKNKGWILGGVASTPDTIKTIDRWTLQEIEDFIMQLEASIPESSPGADGFQENPHGAVDPGICDVQGGAGPDDPLPED
jgi:hypothetical protein